MHVFIPKNITSLDIYEIQIYVILYCVLFSGILVYVIHVVKWESSILMLVALGNSFILSDSDYGMNITSISIL